MTIQVWQHIKSGERYVVDVEGVFGSATVTNAVGPLHHSEIAACLTDGFDGEIGLAEWLTTHETEFAVDVTDYLIDSEEEEIDPSWCPDCQDWEGSAWHDGDRCPLCEYLYHTRSTGTEELRTFFRAGGRLPFEPRKEIPVQGGWEE